MEADSHTVAAGNEAGHTAEVEVESRNIAVAAVEVGSIVAVGEAGRIVAAEMVEVDYIQSTVAADMVDSGNTTAAAVGVEMKEVVEAAKTVLNH